MVNGELGEIDPPPPNEKGSLFNAYGARLVVFNSWQHPLDSQLPDIIVTIPSDSSRKPQVRSR